MSGAKEQKRRERAVSDVYARIERGLAAVYAEDYRTASIIARLCDEHLDRSGALLGRVRDLARAPR